MSNVLALREKIVELFENVGLPKELEPKIYKWIQTKYSVNIFTLHSAKCCQIINQVKKNPSLKDKNLLNIHYKNISPHKWSLFGQDLKILDEKIKDFDHKIYATNMFTCFKCNKKECVYSEAQIRSCDENTTVFVRCRNCHHCFTV